MSSTPDLPDDSELLAIARSIAAGERVDWDRHGRDAARANAALFRELRSLEAVVGAHLRLGETDASETVAEPLSAQEPEISTWAHLTIVEKLGEGSFGAIYRAHDARLATDVALKLLSPRGAPGERTQAARVLNEARLLAKVRHPNVVRVFGADETQSRVGLWMEFIKGRTLETLLLTQGLFSAREAAIIGLDLCRAVAAVHQAGLIHGDIKAHNVMREDGGRTVLMDFGAGHDLTSGSGPDELTGTPTYLAPEMLSGAPQNKATDMYAVGILLYHVATAEYPVSGRTWSEILRKHQHGERARLRDVRPDLPEEFVRVVERAIAPDPRTRYPSAGALEEALAHFLDPGPQTRGSTPRGSRRFMLVAAGAVLMLAAVGVWLFLGRSAPPGRAQSAMPVPAASGSANTPATAAASEIDAAFFRVTDSGEQRLPAGSRVAPGDRLGFAFQATTPMYLYIVNEPDVGEAYLLFPLPGQRLTNPLPANEPLRLPGDLYWQVTSAGGREHFVVFASAQRLAPFEEAFAALGTPSVGRPLNAAPLAAATADRLRSVGGLVPVASNSTGGVRFASLFTTPLTGRRETATDLWVRQLTLENPPK